MSQTVFNSMELDAIGELMNISLGSSATAVSNMLDHRVDITTPRVQVVSVKDFSIGDLEPAIGIEIKYVSGLEGSNIMMLRRSDVKTIVDILMGSETPDEEFELNDMTISAVCEVMNQMMGAASTALSDFLGRPVNISTPESFALDNLQEFKKERFPNEDGSLVVVRFVLGIERVLQSEFVNVMSVELARDLLNGFEMSFDMGEPAPEPEPAPAPAPAPASGGSGAVMSQDEIEKLSAAQS
ncbi:MAG: chemotaxis protein CheC, partial [Candidatus Faecalibacterium intestinavium]|nr:chemotaxis protein CheC [Candidatus Faecalibacterium intestinavium]